MDESDPPARLLYGTDEIFEDMDDRYEELAPKYRSEHKTRLTKIRDFYPALLRAGLDGTTLEEELEID